MARFQPASQVFVKSAYTVLSFFFAHFLVESAHRQLTGVCREIWSSRDSIRGNLALRVKSSTKKSEGVNSARYENTTRLFISLSEGRIKHARSNSSADVLLNWQNLLLNIGARGICSCATGQCITSLSSVMVEVTRCIMGHPFFRWGGERWWIA